MATQTLRRRPTYAEKAFLAGAIEERAQQERAKRAHELGGNVLSFNETKQLSADDFSVDVWKRTDGSIAYIFFETENHNSEDIKAISEKLDSERNNCFVLFLSTAILN